MATGRTLSARPRSKPDPAEEVTPAPAPASSVIKGQNLQDAFLNYIRREKIPVTLFLMNGFQLRGVVRSFDSFVVLIDADGRQQMIYKHAISTVAPARPVSLELQG